MNTKNSIPELEYGYGYDLEDGIRPDYYKDSGYECIDVLRGVLSKEAYEGFCLGNIFKYLWRRGQKGDGLEDLVKARTYLDFLIESEASDHEDF